MTALNPPFKAPNMDALYKVVCSATYPTIPNYYSKDLGRLIGMLLQADPKKRPSCEELLALKTVKKNYAAGGYDEAKEVAARFNSSGSVDSDRGETLGVDLLKTIHMPKKLSQLCNILPKANYHHKDSVDSVDDSEINQLLNHQP
jgi:NIMA (never in mitosis gene a)-related kinase 1/4/5